MRIAVLAVLVAVTSFARADDACHVRVIKAPKRVRVAIEARAGIEAACTPLDVTVIKRGKKLLVTARSDDGAVHEGKARDAGRVAELVMSWAAPSEPVDPAPVTEPIAVVETPAPAAEPQPEPLSATERIVVAPRTRETGRDIGVGVLASPIAYGLRAEVDALVWRGFSIGIALGAGDSLWSAGDAMTGATIELRDLTAGGYLAKTFGTGAWRLRMQGGAGVVYTRYTANARTAPFDRIASGDGTTRMLDAAITLSRELSSSWAVSLGPLLTYYAQRFNLDATRAPARDYDVGGYLAIKKRL